MMETGTAILHPDRSNRHEYRKILAAVRNGELIRLRNGLYAHKDAITGNIMDIEAIIPRGVLCLYSAWAHYRLTTQIPKAFYVAVERSRKVHLPIYPEIKPVFQRMELLEIGKTEITEEGIKLYMTDLERSVCDAVKYRNKIGMDVMVEIINNYLIRSDRNLSRLTLYAKRLRVYNTLFQILQVKL